MMDFALGIHSLIEGPWPWYDTRTGILMSIKSLEGLNRLVDERRVAGYERKERLNEWFILGRYYLDACGNCLSASSKEKTPKELLPNIPDVMGPSNFWDFVKVNIEGEENQRFSWSYDGGRIPLPILRCGFCGKCWSIDDCHDTTVKHKTEVLPLEDFAGQTLGGVKMFYEKSFDYIFRMQPDVLIKNDRFIDLSPKYPDATEDWKRSLVKNRTGWVGKKDGITDSYVIQKGDEGFFNVWTYFHKACYAMQLSVDSEKEFKKIFHDAGFKNFEMAGIPNGYCPCESCAPWWNVKTEFGTIKIGWRKHVINIDWSELNRSIKRNKILKLFTKEDVTKEKMYIHAWDNEKATEYLRKIRSHLRSN